MRDGYTELLFNEIQEDDLVKGGLVQVIYFEEMEYGDSVVSSNPCLFQVRLFQSGARLFCLFEGGWMLIFGA